MGQSYGKSFGFVPPSVKTYTEQQTQKTAQVSAARANRPAVRAGHRALAAADRGSDCVAHTHPTVAAVVDRCQTAGFRVADFARFRLADGPGSIAPAELIADHQPMEPTDRVEPVQEMVAVADPAVVAPVVRIGDCAVDTRPAMILLAVDTVGFYRPGYCVALRHNCLYLAYRRLADTHGGNNRAGC